MEQKIKILIAEDQHLLAKLLKNELNTYSKFEVMDIASDGELTLEKLSETNYDVLLLDIQMPKIDGLSLLPTIKEKYPELKIIMLSNVIDGAVVKKAIEFGAHSYVCKFVDIEEIYNAINSVLNNEAFFDKISFKNFINNVSGIERNNLNIKTDFDADGKSVSVYELKDNSTLTNILESLTEREKQVLKMIIEEKSSKEISEKLYISDRTVETHRKNIMRKLGVKNTIGIMKVMMEFEHSDNNSIINSLDVI